MLGAHIVRRSVVLIARFLGMQRFVAEEFQILNKVEGFKDASEEAYKEKEMEKVSQFPDVNFMQPRIEGFVIVWLAGWKPFELQNW